MFHFIKAAALMAVLAIGALSALPATSTSASAGWECPPPPPPTPRKDTSSGGMSMNYVGCGSCDWAFGRLAMRWIAENPGKSRDDFFNTVKKHYAKIYGWRVGFWVGGPPCGPVGDMWKAVHPEWDGNQCGLTDPLPGYTPWKGRVTSIPYNIFRNLR